MPSEQSRVKSARPEPGSRQTRREWIIDKTVPAIFAALRQLVSRPLRRILWRSVGLALALLVGCWFALTRGVSWWLAGHPVSPGHPSLDTAMTVLTSFGLFIALGYLMPAVSALVASFFVDDAALIVEESDFPAEPPGRPLSFGRALMTGFKFAGLSLLVNAVALVLLFIPGVNVPAFFVALAANGYLLGREYFEMAATRFGSPEAARQLRSRHAGSVFVAGIAAACLLLIPVVSLVTPIFTTALMVHLHKRLTGSRPGRRLSAPPLSAVWPR